MNLHRYMKNLAKLCIFSCALVFHACYADSQGSKTKILRTNNQRLINFSTSDTQIDAKRRNGNHLVEKPRQTTSPRALNVQSLLINARDEVADIFDSIAFAETNEERLNNIAGAIHRHRLIISAGTLMCAAKYAFVSKRGAQIGKTLIKELREKEVQRWGKRAAGL